MKEQQFQAKTKKTQEQQFQDYLAQPKAKVQEKVRKRADEDYRKYRADIEKQQAAVSEDDFEKIGYPSKDDSDNEDADALE